MAMRGEICDTENINLLTCFVVLEGYAWGFLVRDLNVSFPAI